MANPACSHPSPEYEAYLHRSGARRLPYRAGGTVSGLADALALGGCDLLICLTTEFPYLPNTSCSQIRGVAGFGTTPCGQIATIAVSGETEVTVAKKVVRRDS